MNELAEMCTSVGVISKGRLVMQGELPTLLRRQQERIPMCCNVLNFLRRLYNF